MNAIMSGAVFNFSDPRLIEDPFPLYRELREKAPVYWVNILSPPGWLVTRYDDCVRVLANREEFAPDPRTREMYEEAFPEVGENPSGIEFSAELNRKAMFLADLPYHALLRGTANRAFFGPKSNKSYGEHLQGVIANLLSNLEGRRQIDLVAEYSAHIPYVMLDYLDFPMEDRKQLRGWIKQTAMFFGGAIVDAEALFQVDIAMRELLAYVLELIKERRANCGSDALSLMLNGAEKHGLPDRDLGLIVLTLFGAGHATLVNNITMGAVTLLANPEQLVLLKQQPELWPEAIDELLRFNTPQKILLRKAAKDLSLGNQEVKKGQMVYAIVAAANRDPEIFKDAERLDITRHNARKHLAHGVGPHYCLGATLSQTATRTALEQLFQKFPDLQMDGQLTWIPSHFFRGLEAMPVSL